MDGCGLQHRPLGAWLAEDAALSTAVRPPQWGRGRRDATDLYAMLTRASG